MRKFLLLFALTVLSLALAGTASAQCQGCNFPCNDYYECNVPQTGYIMDCWSIPDCGGCNGWFDPSCIGFFGQNELEPKEPEPLLGVKRVTAVVVRHDPAPVRQPAPVQIALAQ